MVKHHEGPTLRFSLRRKKSDHRQSSLRTSVSSAPCTPVIFRGPA